MKSRRNREPSDSWGNLPGGIWHDNSRRTSDGLNGAQDIMEVGDACSSPALPHRALGFPTLAFL